MNTLVGALVRLPAELKALQQWAVAGADKAPLSADSTGKLFNVSVTNPKGWLTFDQACHLATHYANHVTTAQDKFKSTIQQVGLNVGFILSAEDPFTCIDLDVKDHTNEPDVAKHTTPEQWDRFWSIVQRFDCYTERSRSGKGLHVWVRGKIGKGCKRDGVELYSQERFIICTGNVVLDKAVSEKQQMLEAMASLMRPVTTKYELTELPEVEEDWEVIEKAMNASNGDKFNALCSGRIEDYGFPSQSEADLALMSMFTFYSQSNEQCRRLFRMTALGKREKAVKDDRYLNFTLQTIRARQEREARMEAGALLQAADERVRQEQLIREELSRLQGAGARNNMTPLHVPCETPVAHPAPPTAAIALTGPASPALAVHDKGLDWPPGLAGAIAGFIYQSAPRPVKEVAIVAAMGLLAGICGKAFCIPQSGLNMYMILVARSAIGKEAMHSGISAIMQAAASRQPPAMSFVDFSDFASGPALAKAVAANPCFVNVAGEWGRKLKRLATEDGRESPMQALRTVMTNLYQKSGPQSIVGGITYSNKESNIASVSGVAYSMIGETTPSTFYDSLTESMMEDGFLSRFTIVEYEGDRPPLNTSPLREPSKALGDAVADLCTHALTIMSRHETVAVDRTAEAAAIMWSFEQECDNEINSTNDETWRQMWNRASLKVMRVSALLAVADNWYHPVINETHVKWALDLIRRDIAIMSRRVQSGDVGQGDHARENKILYLMAEYLRDGAAEGYRIPEQMWKDSIIPYKYLQIRTAKVSSFTNHRGGATAAIQQVVKSLMDSGYIMEVSKDKISEMYNFYGKCFRILNLPDATKSHLKNKRK